MRTTAAEVGERRPQRSRLDDPAGSFRRGELAAGLATAALFVHLLFAQVTLLLAVVLVTIGRGSRWRPHWLLLPALASLCWLLAAGVDRAAASFATGSQRLAGFLVGAAVHPARLAHLSIAWAGAGTWLPRELPLAMLAATGEATAVLWLCWWRRGRGWRDGWRSPYGFQPGVGRQREWQWRPGLCAALRRRISAAALAAGHTVTSDGCALGLDASTGKRAGFSWAEAEQGVLLAGRDQEELDQLGVAAVCAALRLRKTVLVLDLGATGAGAKVAGLARSLGVPATEISTAGPGRPEGTAGGRKSGRAAGPETEAMSMVADGGPDVAGAIGRAIRGRGVVLITARHPGAARQVTGDLAGVLAGLRGLGLRGDTLAWIAGCDLADPGSLAEALALGPLTGTAIVLSAPAPLHAGSLAPASGVLVVTGPIPGSLAGRRSHGGAGAAAIGHHLTTGDLLWAPLANRGPMASSAAQHRDRAKHAARHILDAQRPGTFAILDSERPGGGPRHLIPNCQAVPITPGHVR